jgi:hypothetical protein
MSAPSGRKNQPGSDQKINQVVDVRASCALDAPVMRAAALKRREMMEVQA